MISGSFRLKTLSGERETLHTGSFQIVTNNPLVADSLSGRYRVCFLKNGSDREVMVKVRDLIHRRHRLLTAPLSGSVKPWETPYRSIMLSSDPCSAVDATSLDLIERAMEVINRSHNYLKTTKPSIDHDFQIVDLSLIESALPSAEAIGRI